MQYISRSVTHKPTHILDILLFCPNQNPRVKARTRTYIHKQNPLAPTQSPLRCNNRRNPASCLALYSHVPLFVSAFKSAWSVCPTYSCCPGPVCLPCCPTLLVKPVPVRTKRNKNNKVGYLPFPVNLLLFSLCPI